MIKNQPNLKMMSMKVLLSYTNTYYALLKTNWPFIKVGS